jgi:hypothetical protein
MSATIDHLSGAWENFDDTLRCWIYDNWTDSNTRSLTPEMLSPNGRNTEQTSTSFVKNGFVWFDNENEDEIVFNVLNTTVNADESSVSLQTLSSEVAFDIQAVDSELAQLIGLEINRIIMENYPNSGTRINKTDGTSSAISTFGDFSIDWINPSSPETNEYMSGARLSGLLTVKWIRSLQ